MDEQAAFEEQKANCIFCQIVSGKVPSKKVFEDEEFIGILDINPATKGHVLFMPKEHYPILPLIPFERMQRMFSRISEVSGAIKDALVMPAITVFIANGGAAGQQSPHFLLHLIPREQGDMLGSFDIPNGADAGVNESACAQVNPRFSSMMQAYLSQTGRQSFIEQKSIKPETSVAQKSTAQETESQTSKETDMQSEEQASNETLDRLITLINENDDLKLALIDRPEEVKEAVRTQEKFKKLFAGVDIDKLSANLKAMTAAGLKKQGIQPTQDTKQSSTTTQETHKENENGTDDNDADTAFDPLKRKKPDLDKISGLFGD